MWHWQACRRLGLLRLWPASPTQACVWACIPTISISDEFIPTISISDGTDHLPHLNLCARSTGVQLVSLVDEQVASDMASTIASEVHDLLKVRTRGAGLPSQAFSQRVG
eukprot:1138735-Pelagomonas_calceolata.AAC.3